MAEKLTWSKAPPEHPGWYWWRQRKGKMPHCYWVTSLDGRLGVFHQAHLAEFSLIEGEWWPVPIEPPTS